MKTKMITILLALLLMLSACSTSKETNSNNNKEEKEKVVKVGIIQLVEHPSLDAAREGFIEALKDAGYEEGKNLEIDYQNAQGEVNNNTTIAQKFVADEKDLILAIATSSAQAVAKSTTSIPILFTAITDPVGAKLVESLEKPGGNVTGTSDTHPDAIKNTIKSIKDFFPDAKKVGIVYNSGEPNAVTNVENAKIALKNNGLEPVLTSISTTAEVKQAAESLVDRVDVFYVPKDNTVVAGLESIIKIANDYKIPTFVGEGESVKRGTFASWGLEYHDLGMRTGEMGVEILKGKKPSEIPVEFPAKLELFMNKKAAEAEGIKLTEEMTKNAKIVGN
jgi:putative tryptophan/tyrosine transport system substrate-binding protein